MQIALLKMISRYWLPVAALIFLAVNVLSLWPLAHLPRVPGTDKTHHFVAYALLTFPVALSRPAHWPKILLLFLICSGVVELLQPLVNRYCELFDFIANGTGIVCGIIISTLVRKITQHPE